MSTDEKTRHDAAMASPRGPERAHVQLHRAIVTAAAQWAADEYAADYLADLCRAARGLLNMESGRLHCGTLDAYYCDVLRRCGEEP